jgi:PKD repeat protein
MVLGLLCILQATGQALMPDSICMGAQKHYWVFGNPGSTYTWKLTDPSGSPTILPGTGDTVMINWTMAPGTYTLTTLQHSVYHCDGVLQVGLIELFEQAVDFAGNPKIFCTPDPYMLSDATASFYKNLLWTTSGDGSFDNNAILHPIYTPGSGDLLAGTVTLTLTAQGMGSGNTCTPAVSSLVVHQSATILAVTATATNVSCFGFSDGTATANPIGGTGTYTYLWNDPAAQTTITATGLVAGTYIVIVTDGNNCTATDTITITQPPSIMAFAGADTLICETQAYTLSAAAAANYSSLIWTTSGTGLFNDPTVLNPVYTPSIADITAGSVTLTLTAHGINLCPDSSDSMILSISRQAIADAGADTTICQSAGSLTLVNATASHFTTLLWTSSGTGTFNNANLLNPIYTPSAADILSGSVVLTLNAFSASPCITVNDQMTLHITKQAIAFAGPDNTMCETQVSYPLASAAASNYASILWTTSGTGTFTDPTLVNTVYTPSAADIASGSVILTLKAVGIVPCADSIDSMVLSISRQAIVSAGADTTICETSGHLSIVNSTAIYATSLLWTSSGTGSFSNATVLHPDYTPSVADIASGSVILTFTGTSAAPCVTVSDQMILHITIQADAYAGPNAIICETQGTYTLSAATASSYISLHWQTSGNGTFNNATLLNPVYTPSVNDIASGAVTLSLTAFGIVPCADSTSSMILTISRQALADAGTNKVICASQTSILLSSASASLYTGLVWTTSGTGNFNNPNIQNPIYFPSLADIASGSVVLTLTASSTPPCVDAVSSMTLTIVPTLIAGAGPNDTSCANYNYTISGAFASNYSSLHWSHNGLGTLNNPNTVNPTYIPAFNETGLITFTLRAYSLPPCTDTITDQMTLKIYPLPTGTIVLLSKDTICGGDTVRLRIDLTGTPPWTFTYSDGTNLTTVTNLFSTPYFINTYPDSTVTYTITSLSDANCTALPGSSNSISVLVHPKPAVEFTWTLGPQNYEVQFHIDSSIVNLGAVGYMCLWNFGDGTFGYGHNPIHFYPGSTTFHCILTITDTNGCSNSIMHAIFVPPVQIAFYSSTGPTCLGTPMCFQDLSTVPNPPATYIKTWVWDFGDGTPNDTIHFPDNPNVCHTYAAIGNYTVTLTIWDNWGTYTSYSHDQQVIPVPIAGFTYSTNCEGQPVQFTDVSSINGSVNIISWNWDFGDPTSGIYNTSNLQNPSHTFTTGSTIYNVRLIIQNFNGCIDTLIKPVYILPKPPVEFTHDSACNEQVVHFVADAGITHIDSIVTWLWDFGDGSGPSYNPVTAMHTYPAPGSYIATLTVTDHHGCFNSVSHGVRVNPLPVPVFSWSTPTCSGSPVHFTDNSTVPSGYTGYIAKWLWEFGDGTSQLVVLPGSPDVTHTFVGPGMTHTVRLTVWTSDSCSQFVEHVVVSIPGPIADFNFSTIHCTDQPVQFTDLTNTNGGGGISQWSWNFGDPTSGINNTSTLQNPVHTFANAGSYTVSFIVTNLTGCTDTINKTVTIGVSPVADFHADTVCLHSPTQFTDLSIANAGNIINYSWNFGDGSAISHLQNPTHTYGLSGIFNVTLSIVNSNGCTKDTTKAVMVNPLPIAAFSFSSPGCLGAAVQYTDLSTTVPGYLGSIVKWVWDFGDGTSVTILAPANPNVSHTFVGTALSHVVRLTVTTSDGCTDYKEQTVTSIPSPIADFGFPATNCTAPVVQFSDLSQNNGGGSIMVWNWNFGDPLSGTNNHSTSQNPVHLYTAPGIYNVTLIILNVSNCSDTVLKTVTISQSPLANFVADTVCLHQPTQFTDLSIPNTTGIISYSWNFGDGSPVSNLQNPAHTYSTYGVKNVTLTVINSNGCIKDTTKQALVRPLPMAAFTFSSGNCKGTPVQFTDASTTIPGYPASIVQWVWNFGDGTPLVTIIFPGNPNVTHLFAGSANAYTVRLTVTTSDGCNDFIEHIVNTMSSPTANFTYPSGNCFQKTVQFTDISQSNGGGNITQWQWNFGDPVSGMNNTSALQNPGHIFTAPGTYNVSEIISNGSGCSDTVTHTITVIPLPVADFTADTACLGSPTAFINQSTSSVGSITLQLWDFGDGTTSTAVNPVHTYLTYGVYQVKLTVTTQDGCTQDTTKQVTVAAFAVTSFTATGPTCLGDSVHFTDNSYAMYGSIHMWQWDFGDGTSVSIIDPASPNISHLYLGSGTYNVILKITTYNGCVSTSMNQIVVQPAPTANYIYSSNRCELSPVQFSDMSQQNGGTPITQWLWDFNDPGSGSSNTSTIPNPVHIFSGSGAYQVSLKVTSSAGCFNSITKAVSIHAKPIAQFSSDTACAGSATQFIDSSVPNAPAISSWNWNFGDPASGTNNVSTLKNPSHVYTNGGNYFVTLTVINSNTCVKDTVLMVPIPSKPVAMFQFNASCVNTPTQFTDLSIAPNSQLSSWFWDFGDGIGTSNLQNPSYTYTTAGTYNVKLRVTNTASCADSIIIPVVSHPLPVSAFNYTSFFCPAGQVIFHDQSHGIGSSIAERLWIFEPGSTSNQHDPTYIFPVTDTTYLVSLIVTDDHGCKDTITDSVYVKPAFSFTFTNDTVCFNHPTQFHAQNNTQGDSLYFIQWNFGDPASGSNNTSTLHNPTHVFTSPQTYTVKLTAWDSDNCADSVYRTVVVHALPAPDYSFVSPPCDSLTLFTDLSSAGSGTISSWSWNFGDGTPVQTLFPPSSGNTTHVYDIPGTYRVSLKVTNSYGCSDTLSHLVARPSCIAASFIQSVGTCANSPVIFTDNSSPVNQINQWHWTFGDGLDTLYTKYANTISHTYTNSGTYLVQLTIRAGVSGQTFMDSATRVVTISKSPESQFSASSVCLNRITLFEDQTNTFGADISSWKWNFGDPTSGINNSSELHDPTHQYHSAGVYNVSLTVINKFGCKDSIRKPTSVFAIPQAKFINTLACSDNPTYFFDRSVAVDTSIGGWNWNFGVSSTKKDTSTLKDPVYNYKKEGHYDVFLIIRDNHGCYDTIDSTITVNPSPLSAFILEDNLSNMTGKIQLKNKSEKADTYFWSFGNGLTSTDENPYVTYKDDGTYTIMLIATNYFGCADTSYYKYEVLFKGLYVPNAFAPTTENQGINQFKPVGVNLKQYKVEVFDSWGHLLWSSSALDSQGRPTEGWSGRKDNGDLYQQGTYVWKINAIFIDGTTWEGSDIGKGEYKSIGTVTLIR